MAASDYVRMMLQQAALLQRAGRFAEAQSAYEHVLARNPDLPDTWYNLARLQRRAGQFDAALASYQQALDRGVTRPEEVHLNRAVIYTDCLRQDLAAEAELNTALALNPRYVPALVNLANLREDYGRREDALAIYERILAIEPQYHEALARYASLKSASGRDDALVGRLRDAIARPGTTSADRASLGFALGKVLDGCGAYEQAFDAYVQANRHSRESAGSGAALYDRRQHEQLIDRLIGTFATAVAPGAADTPSSGPQPVFICGMFRSGSTLVEQMLAAHSRVTAGGEIGYIPALVRGELAPFPESMTRLSAAQLQRIAARYRDALARVFPDADVLTDKRPDNFLYIGLIKSLFPGARIIHTTREPLDNCLSVFFLHLDHSMGYALDLADTAHYYGEYRRLMSHWRALYGTDILDVSYDALVSHPRAELERLLAFCGLPWEDSCMSFHLARTAVRTASVWQVRRPLYQHSSGRWRNYETCLAPMLDELRALYSGRPGRS